MFEIDFNIYNYNYEAGKKVRKIITAPRKKKTWQFWFLAKQSILKEYFFVS